MARSRFDELDNEAPDNEREEEIEAEESDEDEGDFLEGEETLEELDVDERGHVRPRRSRHDQDPEEY